MTRKRKRDVPPAVRAQTKIADATYRRILNACQWYVPNGWGDTVEEHAARITLDVHSARAHPRHPYPQRNLNGRGGSVLDGLGAAAAEEVNGT